MMEICKADFEELNKILELQYLAYKSEAVSFGTNDIPPLKQTMEEVIQEYRNGIILKMISEDNDIIGSVRAREDNGTAYIGKLMVHPDYRCCGCGTKLLMEIEKFYPGKRYELFTSTRSEANIRLYQRNGYTIFDRKPVNDDLVFVYMEKTCDSNKAEVVIGTERLFLREMNMGDYEALYSVLADSDNMQHYPYAFDEGRVRDWIERNMERYRKDGFGLWAVCLKDTGEVIGDCGLTLQAIGMQFDASFIPWMSYDSLNVELPDGYLHFAPIINWGKYREENGRLMMPVSVRLNHAIADGFLVANVYRLLEKEMIAFCNDEKKL